ncbi:flavodoxin family protein [Nocardioides mesophilus]|uniref:Flavodoxin domain-containing protein n=1 Tax=Nocardioides mesophilus TaxID=433659 RepID=A0A7G9R8G0_9ACTN|nr:flavodoxin domain-containing protein [Nocardioides mesophilus]QNN51885.1 flavodoxin domain-containing protein [Nocardioides mesophilus]
MRAWVVYESMFGNTEEVARAVAEGLSTRANVELYDMARAPAEINGLLDLIVVGAPTHAFSLSRPSTRASAIEQGATHGAAERGVREWLEHLHDGPHSELVAAFDTRVDKIRHLPGSAAHKAERLARHHGYSPAGRMSFYVSDAPGPLLPGELDRAREWGRHLAEDMAARAAGRVVR